MDAGVRNRLVLALRSEAAMGLSSVRTRPQVAAMTVESAAPVNVTLFAASEPLPSAGAALPVEQKRSELAVMNAQEVSVCIKCRLCETRTQTVFGEGDPNAKIFFIGEGPGENEDLTGRPFVGRAGQLLDKMIAAMGLSREQVYIANIVKCRPPQNRVPAPDEVATCTPYLERQLNIVRPTVIVTLGRPATAYMLNDPKLTMGRSRGRWHEWRGVKLMPTFHPSYVLRSYTPETRRAVWSDLQQVMAEIGLTGGGRGAGM
jgi:uracil-DNA glycosylase